MGSENEPIEYKLGKCNFLGNVFKCTTSTLIPRKDAEKLVIITLELIKNMKNQIKLMDIGTGTGNIAISIALKNKNTKIYASDISKDSSDVAKYNVNYYNLQNRISLFQGDMFEAFKGIGLEKKIDVIICNPPYIPINKLKTLPKEVTSFEPIQALQAGPFGLKFFKILINESPFFLKNNGLLLFEFGSKQDGMVNRLITRNENFSRVNFYEYNNKKRFVSARCIHGN
jgi:release factor glutamine methyltransferase